MTLRIFSIALFATLAWTGTTTAQQFIDIPNSQSALDITPDGEIVVGIAESGGGYYWRWKVDPTPTLIGGISAKAISDDGSVIIGNIEDPLGTGDSVAARWTAATGWLSLGILPTSICASSAYDVSGDGSAVVGLSWVGCNARGFYWTLPTGMLELQNLANGNNRASAISADGSAIGGFAQAATRTPAFWDPNTSGTLHDITVGGEVYGFTSDGGLSVGTMFQGSANGWFEAFSRTSQGAVTNLGSLNSNMAGVATDISESGGLITGYDVSGLSKEPWVWTPATGIVALDAVLTSIGVSGSPTLRDCVAASDSGNVVVGTHGSLTPGVGFSGYVVEFNSTPWVDLEGGTAGSLGQPVFDASGDLTAGSTLTLDLSNTQPNAIFLMWISLSSNPANVVGGTIYPLPADAKFIFAADALGGFNVSSPVAAGAPSGVDLWFQCLAQDATNIHGITLSNCVRGTTP